MTRPSVTPSAPENDDALSSASHLTREEVIKRRLRRVKQLSKCYRDYYWALMEELKTLYREYYWKYGVSPFKQDQNQGVGTGRDPSNNASLEGSSGENANCNALDLRKNRRCSFVGCKLNAMALTSFCHLHILSDPKQKLYKACTYVIKSAQAGPITCGKPILRCKTPPLCTGHFQKAQKHVNQALRKAGLSVSSSNKLAPKFNVLVTEYVRQIQAKRRAAQRARQKQSFSLSVGEEAAS